MRRSQTGRSRPSGAPRSRRTSRRRPSSPSGSPSRSARSRSHGAPRPRSRRRRDCARASRRSDAAPRARRPAPARRSRRARPPPSSPSRSAFVVLGSGTSAQQLPRGALGPTALAPGASGNATLTKTSSGWRIELDATGLPRLDNGRFYEAWLKRRRRARPDRDVQRRPERDALGRRLAEGLPDADRHARAGRRRSGLVGREGARRPVDTRQRWSRRASTRRTTCCRAR